MSPKEVAGGQDRQRYSGVHSTSSSSSSSTIVPGKSGYSEYMDLSGGEQQLSGSSGNSSYGTYLHGSRTAGPAGAADPENGEYVSLDMSRSWQTRSLSLCEAPEPKKSKSELTATMSIDVAMLSSSSSSALPSSSSPLTSFSSSASVSGTHSTTQHNYENLSFGANGVTVDVVSSLQDSNSQEPMDTDQSNGGSKLPGAVDESTSHRMSSLLLGQPVSPPPTPVPSPGVPMQVVPGSGPLSTLNAVCHELNYASLDLPPASEESPSPSAGHEAAGSGAGIVPPSLGLPNGLSGTSATGVSYSEVDFRKSEGLRGSMLREGGRV